jgi:hypothetical protein
MNKFRFYFILSIIAAVFFSCTSSTDSETTVAIRDYAVQFDADNILIETYLKTHYIKFTDTNVTLATPDFADKEFTLATITDDKTQVSLWSFLGKTTFPQLKVRPFYVETVEHKMYALILREGVNARPINVDGVYAGYKGEILDGTVFDSSTNSEQLYNLDGSSTGGGAGVIRGWSEFFPFLRSGKYTPNADGTVSYSDYGVGVMFLPSVLGYYSSAQTGIDAYSPIIFTVKLFGVKRYDHDADGIPSYLEDLDGDNYMYSVAGYFAATGKILDDTDSDGIANFLDIDDDADGYITKLEIKKPNGSDLTLDGPSLYYPFDPIITTPVSQSTDEKRGIPAFSAKGKDFVDYTSSDRKRIHLDKDHHTAY